MIDSTHSRGVVTKYLNRWAEPLIPQVRWPRKASWAKVLVLPLFDEDTSWLCAIPTPSSDSRTLVIAVVNAPADATPDAKNRTQRLLAELLDGNSRRLAPSLVLVTNDSGIDLLVCDCCSEGRQLLSGGVGLARKLGCDLALAAVSTGHLATNWIATSDADVADYAAHMQAQSSLSDNDREGAAILPFRHVSAESASLTQAHELYELSLWHYVLGLAEAGSPYAYHTIGSTLMIHAQTYAQVRGFPKREAGEDFHLLSKVRKVGSVRTLTGVEVPIRCRNSRRVPFGTGPAVGGLQSADNGADRAKLFFHPGTFATLKQLLMQFSSEAFSSSKATFAEGLGDLADHRQLVAQLRQWGAPGARDRLLQQCRTPAQFQRQWHAWFDGLKTLRLIRALAPDPGVKLSLGAVLKLESWLPADKNVADLLKVARARWLSQDYARLGEKPLGSI